MTHDELRDWLIEHQSGCPGCGYPAHRNDHLHHIFHRRLKQIDDLLWVPINIALVCPTCHVPERHNLNYRAALQKFEQGFTPDKVREWLDGLPLKVKPGLPRFFIRAEERWIGVN